MEVSNIFEQLPETVSGEVFEELVSSGGVRVERIVSCGQASPEGFWYDQDGHEWVLLLQGRAGLRFDGVEGVVVLGPGDWIQIPAHTRHRVEWTDEGRKTIWLAVHYR